jgi:hypothetical protein
MRVLFVCMLMVWTTTGCVTTAEKTPTPKEEVVIESAPAPKKEVVIESAPVASYYLHTIKWGGECLSIIAGWYTGNLLNWQLIAEANPDRDPNRIFLGDTIRIPEHLLTNREPMTKEYLRKFVKEDGGQKVPSKPAASQKTDEKEPELFAPKRYQEKKAVE